jgi:ribosomal protein S18 acetylase RimI-like enzyme
VLQARSQLSDPELAALADLERRVVAHDGGRLKIEWADVRDRPPGGTNDLLWVQDDRLVGFVGFDHHGGPAVELVGAVDPAVRGRGIGTALLSAALDVCRSGEFDEALLIVPRPSAAGRYLATTLTAPLHHSEHALRLTATPAPAPQDPRTTLRDATTDDLGDLAALLRSAFGVAPTHLEQSLTSGRTLVVERDGRPVGTVRLHRDGTSGGVYGFVVHPDQQGRGIGRDVLRRVCREFFADGATSVGLEVAVDNDRALGLYTSVGFEPVTTEDYYALPLDRNGSARVVTRDGSSNGP